MIRFELYLTASRDERAEIVSVCGGQPGMLVVDDTAETHQADATGSVVGHRRRLASQRGGIDSDPIVRLLAYRAWGNRDRQWFELRGVRKGDEISVAASLQYPHTGEWPCGAALEDGGPGQLVRCRIDMSRIPQPFGRVALGSPVGEIDLGTMRVQRGIIDIMCRVSDRLRADPAQPRVHTPSLADLMVLMAVEAAVPLDVAAIRSAFGLPDPDR